MKKILLWFKKGQFLILTLLILFLGIEAVNAQTYPRCQTGCTASDANFSGYWLVVPEGDYTLGEPVSAELYGKFNITRSNGVCCLMSVIDIYLDGMPYSMNFITELGNFTSSGNYDVLLSTITWPYGAELVLKNIYAQWEPGTGSPCPTCDYGDCDMYSTPSKCYFNASPVIVPAPLVARIDWSADCVGDSLYSNVTYTNNSTGGYPPLAVTWDLGPTDDYVIVQGDLDEGTVVVNYKSVGLKEAWLYIEDSELQKDTASVDTVDVISCCEPVLVTCPGDEYFDACSDSLEIVAAYTEWMTGFQYTGGCNATHNKEAIPDLPDNIACIGDTIIFEYIAWDRHTADTCTSTFAVAAAPDVLLTVPQNNTIQACTSQGYINTAFAEWLAEAEYEGGCGAQWSTFPAAPTAPDACGDSVMVIWTVTSDCEEDVKDSAYFKVDMAPEVMLWVPNDTIIDACTTQSEIDAEFTAWLAKAGYTGGCNHDWSTYPADPAAPDACGDSVMVVWTVTSDCEAPVIDSAYFKVEMAPEVVLNVPPDTTISEWVTQEDINDAFADWLAAANFTGGCDAALTMDPAEPASPDYCGGSVTVTWTVTSDCEDDVVKSATFSVTGDMITPTITCNDTSVCLRPNGFYILSEADKKVLSGYVSDNITSLEELGITVTPDYFTCDQVGEDVPVIITVTDLCGNTSRCTTYVTVCDDIDPVITCIDDVTASADEGACSAVVDFSVEATDNCEANITYSHEPGTEFMVGTTEVWAIATDKAGNADTCMFNVVVTEDEPPVVNCPDDMVIYGTDNESGAMVEFAADATDNCGDATLSYSQESGTYFPVGTTTVTVTATDEAGNTAMCEFDVTVIDDENPPVVDKPAEDVVVHANQETKMPVDSVFNDPDGDDLTIEVSMADGSPVPDWIDLEGDSLVFTPVPADTGCVNVVLTATNMAGASVSDTFEVCVDYANLVDISAGKFEVQLYPNPTPGEVNIDLKPGALREILVTVFDITGKPVLVRNYSPSGRIIFDMTGRATGMYFVRIDFDGHSVLKKLVVERQ